MLQVQGEKIVDEQGNEVILRGAGLGGWMNQISLSFLPVVPLLTNNFITGYPGREFQIRDALDGVLGKEKAKFYWDKFLEYFFTPSDAKFFKSLGLNCIRIAFNYRHFEDDMNPYVLLQNEKGESEGFKWLDRVIDICAAEGIYTILDLHAVAGGQNTDWHSDNPTHVASFWVHKDFQDRAIWLWEVLAKHYKGNRWIAGYNILNEPTDPTHSRLQPWYLRCIKAIRDIDQEVVIFLDGNTFASDFTHFTEEKGWNVQDPLLKGVVYSVHDYSLYGFPKSEEVYTGSDAQKERVRKTYDRKTEWMREKGLPIWNGEWGPVYARLGLDGTAEEVEKVNKSRYALLKDQLHIYEEERISWSIWLYKDIGFQGMVHVDKETPYMKQFDSLLKKKHLYGVDSWGSNVNSPNVKPIQSQLEAWITEAVPDESHRRLYPFPIWQFKDRIAKISRNILLAEYLVQEWAENFRGKTEEELDELAKSFLFENCVKREGLNSVLTGTTK